MTDRPTLLVLLAMATTACSGPSSSATVSRGDDDSPTVDRTNIYAKPSDEVLRQRLTPMEDEAGQTAILAGGCFWGMEDLLRKIPGVTDTEVGYTGGRSTATTYEQVSDGTTGQAEAVRIVFDPKVLSYADLLEKWFPHARPDHSKSTG